MESNFFKHVWTDIRHGRNVEVYLTVLISLIVLILSILNFVDIKIVTGAILAVLSLQAISLLTNRRAEKELKLSLEEVLNQQHQPRLADSIVPYGERSQEIISHLTQADEVWILSRTCRRIWSDNQDELQTVARRNGLKLLILNPSDGAFDMIEKSTIWQQPGDGDRLRTGVNLFVSRLEHIRKTLQLENFEVRAIDYLPAWTLILINPRKNDGVVYVEMATYRAHSRKRPSFILDCSLDNHLFEQFRDEFEQMWNDAKPAWEQVKPDLTHSPNHVN